VISDQNLATIALLMLSAGLISSWAAGKWLTCDLDKPDWWDLLDALAGAAGAVIVAIYTYAIVALDPAGPGFGPIWAYAVRNGAAFGWATFLSCWLASIWIETESEISVPPSLEPIEQRAYEIHLGWAPFVSPPDQGD